MGLCFASLPPLRAHPVICPDCIQTASSDKCKSSHQDSIEIPFHGFLTLGEFQAACMVKILDKRPQAQVFSSSRLSQPFVVQRVNVAQRAQAQNAMSSFEFLEAASEFFRKASVNIVQAADID